MLSVMDAVVLGAVVLSVVQPSRCVATKSLGWVVATCSGGSRWKQATAPSRARFCGACAVRKFLAKCPCPRCSVLLPCSCADDVDEVLRQVRQKKTTMFETNTSTKALSVARESVERRGERAQRGKHLRLDARVVLDELRSSSCRPPLNFTWLAFGGAFTGVRRRRRSACAACAAVSGVGAA